MKIFLIVSQLLILCAHPAICALIKKAAAPPPALTKSASTINRRHLKAIEGSMDLITDPCENFYQFSCGNWDNLHSDVSKYHDYYRMIDYYTNREMAIVLSDKAKTEEPKFAKDARAYFKSCVGMKHLDLSLYLKWLAENENLNTIVTANGKSSVEKNVTHPEDWLRYLAVLNKYGLSGVFLEETYFNGIRILKFTRPLRNGGFKPMTYMNFEILTKLTFHWTNDTLENKWSQMSKLENDLKKLQFIANGTSQSFTMATISNITWLHRYVHMLLDNTKFSESKLRIIIKDISYMTGLYKILQTYDDTFLCEYLQIRFIYHIIENVHPTFSAEICARKAREFMYLAMDWIFERQHPLLVQSIPKIHNMFDNIKKHYKKILQANPNGFNTTIMEFLLAKLNSTQLQVGHLPRNNTEQRLETIYSDLHLNESNYYGNQMQLLKFKTNHTVLNYISSTNRSEYVHHKKMISPYFHRLFNIVVLPITTLQLPIYDANLDDLYQYSSVGYILGHEITHCFDTMGTKRDRNGRLIDIYHDMINANPKFKENLSCIRRLNNGEIDEKIADVTGFRVAFQTYFEMHPHARHMAINVNGMNVTMDKLFFLNHGQFRCSSAKNKKFSDKSHGTPEDRIIDALSHFPEFVKTFECPKYTDMHLEKTCQLWRK